MSLRLHALRAFACILAATCLVACGGGGGGGDDDESTSADGGGTGTGTGSDGGTGSGSGSGGDSSSTPLGETRTGEGTFYGATGQGACSFDATSNRMIAAMNHTDYAGSAACGEFVRVTGPKGTITVRIVDECPECKPGDIDLSEEAFALIADPVAGRVPISWQVVRGNLDGPVQYRFKEGSTRWWTAIQVRNHELPVASLQILPNGASKWINVERTTYNYFVHPTEIASGSLKVRIKSINGDVLEDTLPEPKEKLLVEGAAQFP